MNTKPHYGGAFLLLMNEKLIQQLTSAGRLSEGQLAIEQLLLTDPGNSSAWELLFLINVAKNDKDAALDSINHLLALEKNSSDAWMNKGNLLHEMGHDHEAIRSFDKSIELNPNSSFAHSNKSNSLLKINKIQEAIESCDKAISLNENNQDAWMNKGNCYLYIGNLNEAEFLFNKAISISPNSFKAWINLARTLNANNQDIKAINIYEQALKINPKFAQAYINLGYTHNRLGDYINAINNYEIACEIDKNIIPAAKWNMALIYLANGRFEKGWELYENRWLMEEFKDQIINLESKKWDGVENIKGKIILIYSEQGLGDVIQFSRFLKILINFGANVIFQAPVTLVKLLKTLSNELQIISTLDQVPDHDYNLPLMSLPLKLKIFNTNLFENESYLKSPDINFKNIIKCDKPNIGIAWSGNSLHKNDIHRSIEFNKLITFINKWKKYFSFHSLQKEYKRNELDQLKVLEVIDYSSHLHDFSSTADLINQMDLIICVDTSIAHVSGAIGKPTWLLLAKPADFRWLIDRSDTPWYSSVKLYRQTTAGDWNSVLQAVDADLSKKLREKSNKI